MKKPRQFKNFWLQLCNLNFLNNVKLELKCKLNFASQTTVLLNQTQVGSFSAEKKMDVNSLLQTSIMGYRPIWAKTSLKQLYIVENEAISSCVFSTLGTCKAGNTQAGCTNHLNFAYYLTRTDAELTYLESSPCKNTRGKHFEEDDLESLQLCVVQEEITERCNHTRRDSACFAAKKRPRWECRRLQFCFIKARSNSAGTPSSCPPTEVLHQ